MQVGQDALIGILTYLICIGVTWWSLQAINYERIISKNRTIQARSLFIIITIVIASLLKNFILDYWHLSILLSNIFR